MAKKKDTKRKKKRVNPITSIENIFPDIPVSLYVIVPFCVGFAISVYIFQNIPIGLVSGFALTGIAWMLKEKLPEPPKPVTIDYTADDLVLGIFDKTWFVSAVPADEYRPEAYSIDGQRWSHKLQFTTEYGDTDVFVLRGSLVTGESWLEYIEGESKHQPDFWDSGEDNKESDQEFDTEPEPYVEPEPEQESGSSQIIEEDYPTEHSAVEEVDDGIVNDENPMNFENYADSEHYNGDSTDNEDNIPEYEPEYEPEHEPEHEQQVNETKE